MDQIISEYVNIDVCPQGEDTTNVQSICVGDLHGNAIKLLYFLIRQGVCTLSPNQYERLVVIYKMPLQQLAISQLEEFKTIIADMSIINRHILIRLLGDELADRGSNDFFILLILQKLHQEQVNMEIILSNHGIEFIEAYERYAERGNRFMVTRLDYFAISLQNLAYLVEHKLITAEEVFIIITSSYKPMLKFISCSLDPTTQGLTLFSHAAIDLQILRILSLKFNVKYKDNTSNDLATTIEQINQHYIQYVNKNCVYTLQSDEVMIDCNVIANEKSVVTFTLWNRIYKDLVRPAIHNGYPLYFVHGHDSGEPTTGNIYNLDSNVGKTLTLHFSIYKALIIRSS